MTIELFTGTWRRTAVTGVLAAATAFAPALQAQRKPAVPTDQVINVKVQNALNAEHVFDGMTVVPTTSHGVVTLSGTVTSAAARILASNEAGSVTGVKTVLNNLFVQTQTAAAPLPPALPPAAAIPQAAPPGPRETRSILVPSGTIVAVRTTDALTSKTAQVNEEFHGTVAADVIQDGFTVIPQGSAVLGRVVEAKEAGHFSGSAVLTIELESVRLNTAKGPENLALVTDPVSNKAKGRGTNTAEKTAGGAGIGALIGALAGGGAGAGIGALAGGGLGAGANGVTRGQEVTVPAETLLRFTLSSSASVPVALRRGKQVLLPPPTGPALRVRRQDSTVNADVNGSVNSDANGNPADPTLETRPQQ